eukprot:6190642-Pleurochrysis_carterae.AAC.1
MLRACSLPVSRSHSIAPSIRLFENRHSPRTRAATWKPTALSFLPLSGVAQKLPADEARQAMPDAHQQPAHFQLGRLVGGHVGRDGHVSKDVNLHHLGRGATRQAVATLHRQAPSVQGLPQQRHVGV